MKSVGIDTPGYHLSDDPEIQELQKQLTLVQAHMNNAGLRRQLAHAQGLLAEREEMDHKALHQHLVNKLNELNSAKNGNGVAALDSADPLAPKENGDGLVGH